MRGHSRLLFLVLVAAQVLAIVGLAAGRELTLGTGHEVILRTAPRDPRDLLRGDYVVLGYEISTIEDFRAVGLGLTPGETVYVRLIESGGRWAAYGIDRRPTDKLDTTIRGIVTRATDDQILVTYGIEQFFVPEGRGHEIERAGDIDVVVALDRDGGAVIRYLVVDGEKWDPYR
jgi:uncharacterized membrane-anchored protein